MIESMPPSQMGLIEDHTLESLTMRPRAQDEGSYEDEVPAGIVVSKHDSSLAPALDAPSNAPMPLPTSFPTPHLHSPTFLSRSAPSTGDAELGHEHSVPSVTLPRVN